MKATDENFPVAFFIMLYKVVVTFESVHICVIDQACSVKMAGHWPSSFCAFLWIETKSVSKNEQKERGQYSAILTEQAWSMKDLLYGQKISPKIFAFAGTSGKDRPILLRFILPACGASHIIRNIKM